MLLQRASTVGIDIGHEYLYLVRGARGADGKWRVLNRRRLTLPEASRNAPEFVDFLKASLTSFCESAKQSELWATMSAAGFEVRHIRIPRVPRKQIANAVYWTAKKEAPFNEEETIFDYQVQGEVIDQGIPKLAVMFYTAPRQQVEAFKSLFDRIGWPLTGISIIPFSIQNLFRTGWIPLTEGSLSSLFIGNDFSRIDIFNGGNLILTRGIKAGVNSMVETLIDRVGDTEGTALTMDQGRKIVLSLSPDSPSLKEGDAGFGVSKEDIFEMMRPAVERLVRQVERTFEHYATLGGSERIRHIFVSGAMNVYQPLVDYIGGQLDLESGVFDPLSEHDPVPCQDVDDRHCISDRIAFTPALGMALSDSDYTPNLIYTYKDKEKSISVARINRGIFAVFLAALLVCAGIFIYQGIGISQKKSEIARLETQLAGFVPRIDRGELTKMMEKVKEQRKLSTVYADRYLGMIVISELAALTPANIRLLDLKINLKPAPAASAAPPPPAAGTPAKTQAPSAAKPSRGPEEAVLEGLILGDRQTLESSLASYAMLLETSPLFRQVTIQKNSVAPYLKGEALHFILKLNVEEQVHG
jgi:Tfp pilus assembly PilM family ATPase